MVVQELMKRYKQGLPRLDPIEDFGIQDPRMISAVREIENLERALSHNEIFKVTSQFPTIPISGSCSFI